MRSHFYADEEKTLAKLLTLRELIAEQHLHNIPCPLFESQLNELAVLTGKFSELISAMQKHNETAKGD